MNIGMGIEMIRDSIKKEPQFKYIVRGDHPVFRRIDRRCVSFDEANNVKVGLEAIGYEIKIEDWSHD